MSYLYLILLSSSFPVKVIILNTNYNKPDAAYKKMEVIFKIDIAGCHVVTYHIVWYSGLYGNRAF
jgi:hypothetical protein